jgi:hypothetical protein
MKAAVLHEFGAIPRYEDFPDPVAEDGEVVVEVGRAVQWRVLEHDETPRKARRIGSVTDLAEEVNCPTLARSPTPDLRRSGSYSVPSAFAWR